MESSLDQIDSTPFDRANCEVEARGMEDSNTEESKLEQKFSKLAVNLPKSSKHSHQDHVGGALRGQNGCTLTKNIPGLQQTFIDRQPDETGSSSCESSGGANPSSPRMSTGEGQLDTILQALNGYSSSQIEQLFTLYYDPLKGKIILTEAQFTLVRKIYVNAFINNQWSLADD